MKCLELRHKCGVNVRILYDCLLRLAFSTFQSYHPKQIVGFNVLRYVHVKRAGGTSTLHWRLSRIPEECLSLPRDKMALSASSTAGKEDNCGGDQHVSSLEN